MLLKQTSNILFLAIFIVWVCNNLCTAECGQGWIQFQEHCYLYLNHSGLRLNQEDAFRVCLENGGRLPVLDSADIIPFLSASYSPTYLYWLGISDKLQDGEWISFEGAHVTELFWSHGEPNGQATGEDAVCVLDGEVVDASSTLLSLATFDIICQKPLEFKGVHLNEVEGRHIPEFEYSKLTIRSILECSMTCYQKYPDCVSIAFRVDGEDNCVFNSRGAVPLYGTSPDPGGWSYYNMIF